MRPAESEQTRARTNIGCGFVRSPISGAVIDRGLEPDQTVAASLDPISALRYE